MTSFAANETFTIANLGVVLPNEAHTRVISGDYNNDGNMDLFYLSPWDGHLWSNWSALFFKGKGDGTLTADATQPSMEFYYGDAVFMDINNDGNLDLVVTGQERNTATVKTQVYLNSGAPGYLFVLSASLSSSLTGVWGADGVYGRGLLFPVDYDNDGWTDLLICGFDASGAAVTNLYKNNGGTFSLVDAGFDKIGGGSASWGDFNNDGFMDLVMSGMGSTSGTPQTLLYQNNGNGTFSKAPLALPGTATGESGGMTFFADMNSDGYLDIVDSGMHWPFGALYINQGAGAFSYIADSGLIGENSMSAAYGDINYSGFNSIAATGWMSNNGAQEGMFFYNSGNNTFSITNFQAGLAVKNASALLVDLNNDGALDIVTVGDHAGGIGLNNKTQGTNAAPSMPSGLAVQQNGNQYTLTWNKSTDDKTPQNAIRYNIYAKSSDGKVFSFVPANIATGNIKVAGIVPYITATSHTLTLPAGSYEFGVQAVDQAFMSSAFSKVGGTGIETQAIDAVDVIAANGELVINNNTSAAVAFEIVAPNGQILQKGNCAALSSGKYPVAQGVYLVKVTGANASVVKKLIF